jgi:hypothetical protein
MKIAERTRYITNGKVYVRLGRYWQDNSYNKRPPGHGDFWNCQHWPPSYEGRLYLGLGKNRIPMQWLRGQYCFLRGFIAIKRKLLPLNALQYFENEH